MSCLLALFSIVLAAAAPAAVPSRADTSSRAPADSANAAPLLERVSRIYRGLDSYHFAGMVKVTMSGQGQDQNMEIPVVFAGRKPNRSRSEMKTPMMGMTSVSDGRQDWVYVEQLGQYTRKLTKPLDSDTAAFVSTATQGTPIVQYLDLTRNLKSARVVGEPTIEVGGRRIDCYEIEAEYVAPENAAVVLRPVHLWIDKSRSLVLRETREMSMPQAAAQTVTEMKQTTAYQVARVNEPVSDSLFVFDPPPGAHEVSEFPLPGMNQDPAPDFAGKPATDFTLMDLLGKSRSLSSLKGKVVLLDFWASWCGPCRAELPTIVKLAREFRAKGLVVLAVNVGETRERAQAFLKKNHYTLDVLLDRESTVSNQYGAIAIPTVVIVDKRGTIASHFVGLREESDLREALKKAGVE